MVRAYLTVTSISASTNTMDMLNVSMENVSQIVTNTNVLRNMANVSKENVNQHVMNTNAGQVVGNVSKVFARRNAAVELPVHMQFTLEMKIHTMLITATLLALIWEREYSKFLPSFVKRFGFKVIHYKLSTNFFFVTRSEQIAYITCLL